MNEELITVEKWQATKLLIPFKESQHQSAANCLGAQIAFNEVESNPPTFKRCSIPILVRALSASEAFTRNHFEVAQEDQKPEIYLFHTKFDADSRQDKTKQHNIDIEADCVAKFSESFRNEIDELFADQVNKKIYFHGIRANKAGTVCLYYNL